MTDEQLFDLVAPIAIYHKADVCFKKAAEKALRKLKEAKVVAPLCVVDDVDIANWAWQKYDELFGDIVRANCPGLVFGYDACGAKGFKRDSHFEFAGDSSGQFPWYETAELLKKRLADIVE